MNLRCNVWSYLVISLALLAVSSPAQLMPGADAKWRHYQSENFELYSRNSDADSRRILQNLEMVHAISLETFGIKPVRKLPLTVYFFSRDRHFENYRSSGMGRGENVSAIYQGGVDRGVMAMAPLPDYESAQKLAFSSYSSHLQLLMESEPPLWFRLGVSGLMINYVIKSSSMELGREDPGQVSRLQQAKFVPVEVMLGLDPNSSGYATKEARTAVYDESWVLVHYLYFGRHNFSREKVAAFVRYALEHSRNYDAREMRDEFNRQFGIGYDVFNKNLQQYIRSGNYAWTKHKLPAVAPSSGYVSRSVSSEEINVRLAELAFRTNQSAQGKLVLLNAGDKHAARVHEVLGGAAYNAGEWDSAIDRFERALEAGSTNPAIVQMLIRLEKWRRFQRFDFYFRLPDDVTSTLRSRITSLLKTEPSFGEAYELLAWVEATAKEPNIANLNQVQRHLDMVRERDKTLLALAFARVRLNDREGASDVLNAIPLEYTSEAVRSGVTTLRARIEERP